jgi:hypothetical protein
VYVCLFICVIYYSLKLEAKLWEEAEQNSLFGLSGACNPSVSPEPVLLAASESEVRIDVYSQVRSN